MSVAPDIQLPDIAPFRAKMINWGKTNFRDYPWRNTRDPYHLILAEVLLHRTRAEQIVPLYLEAISRFPTIQDISSCHPDELMELLRSAGLNWRIRALHDMANYITKNHGGEVPKKWDELTSLPGVSHYIASAVRCFAYGYSDPILDTNTVRIIGRIFGIPITDSSRRSKRFRNLMEYVIDRENPREFNFSMLDLGAKICIKRSEPLCDDCPVDYFCTYAKGGSCARENDNRTC